MGFSGRSEPLPAVGDWTAGKPVATLATRISDAYVASLNRYIDYMAVVPYLGRMISLPATAAPESSRPFEKWGEAAIVGWQPLPDLLLKHQQDLDLTPTELLVLINILSFWWYVEELPFPRITTLAKRMNVTTRTVQRAIQKMVETGLIQKKKDIDKSGKERDFIDPSGLVKILKKFAVNDSVFLRKTERKELYSEIEAPF